MGQMTLGLLYGVLAPAAPPGFDLDGDPYGYEIVERWNKAQGIDWGTRGMRVHYVWPDDSDKAFLGIWIAVGASGEDDAPSLNMAWRIDKPLPPEWRKRRTAAARLWRKFREWCAQAEKLRIGEPRLWLTPLEVA